MNKALARTALLILSCCLAAGAQAQSAGRTSGIDLSLSDETAYVSFLLNSQSLLTTRDANGQSYGGYQNGSTELSIGGFMSESDDRLAHLSLMAHGPSPTERNRLQFAVGLKAIGGDIAIDPDDVLEGREDTESVGAVAVGFQTGLLLSRSRLHPIGLNLSGFLAPSITSFSDAERYTELGARLDISVIPAANAYVGFRSMGWDTNDYDRVRTERGMHLGIEISY